MAYSDGEVAEALIRLAVNKYNFDLTAQQTGISKSTLKRWAKNEPKKSVSGLLNRAIERMLMVIPEKWDGNEWAIALGILIDKWLLMQGEPTQRTEAITRKFSGLSDDELDDVLEEANRILDEAASGSDHKGACREEA